MVQVVREVGACDASVQVQGNAMQFIELTGKSLFEITHDGGLAPDQLRAMGITEESILRINAQGDLEVRRPTRWEVVGGLLGNFVDRVREETGLDWV